MKRKIALFVAAVMMSAFLPAMNVSAAVKIDLPLGVPSVASDKDWGVDKATIATSPVVQLKQDSTLSLTSESSFTIQLKNAQWSLKNASGAFGANVYFTPGTDEYSGTLVVPKDGVLFAGKDSLVSSTIGYDMVFQDRYNAEVKIHKGSMGGGESKIFVPIIAKLNGEGAAQAIFSDSLGSGVNNNTPITFANAATGTVSVTVDEVKNTSKTLNCGAIRIEETVPGKIEVGEGKFIKLYAPSGFEFDVATAKAVASKGFSAIPVPEKEKIEVSKNSDGDEAYINLKFVNGGKKSDVAGAISLTGLILKKSDTASYGQLRVRVTVPGGDSTYVTVGEYSKSKIEMTAENKTAPEIVNGVYTKDAQDTAIRTLDVTVKETTFKAWTLTSEKDNTFVLNGADKNVRFRYAKIVSAEGVTGSGESVQLSSTANSDVASSKYMTLGQDKLTLKIERASGTTEAMVKLRLGVSVKPGFTGDIVFGTDEENDAIGTALTAVVAKAINPLTVTVSEKKLSVGQVTTDINDVTIKENKAGVLVTKNAEGYMQGSLVTGTDHYDGKDPGDRYKGLRLWIKASKTMDFTGTPVATVTAGDLEIDKCKVRQIDSEKELAPQEVVIEIKRASTTPSEIKLTGLQVVADRTLNDGKYNLIGAGSIVANYYGSNVSSASQKAGGFDVDNVILANDIVTVGGTDAYVYKSKVAVTIGESTIKVDGVDVATDAPSFVEGNNSYIPVRAVVVALGIKDDEVKWDANTKTCSITGLPQLVEFTQGSEYIKINGSHPGFKMDNNATVKIKNNRIYLPVRALGEIVLHCPVGWDEATRTATYN